MSADGRVVLPGAAPKVGASRPALSPRGVGIAAMCGNPGAVVVAVEHAPARLKTLYGAFPQIGNMIGSLLAAVLLVVVNVAVSARSWLDWGWRVPFLLSLILTVLGLVLRTRLSETPDFVAATENATEKGERPSLGQLLRRSAKPLVIALLLWIGPLGFSYAHT